ncbi:MAG: hypothetical protein ACI4QT_00540 [Kiritimatiellia bacterium]
MKIRNGFYWPGIFLFLGLTAQAADTLNTWIGGDQSADSNSMMNGENWDTGVAPTLTSTTTTDSFVFEQDGTYAVWTSSAGSISHPGLWTVGNTNEHPKVTLEFISTRLVNGELTNDNASTISLVNFHARGSNTTIRVHKGLCLALLSTSTGWAHELGPEITLEGDGVLVFNTTTIPSRDYGDLALSFTESNTKPSYLLNGTVRTSNTLTLSTTGTAGVNGCAYLDLAGQTLMGGDLRLGTLDMRGEDGNQSGFGSISLSGGTLVLTGNLITLGDPNGLKQDGTPLTSDSGIHAGGLVSAIRLGGSFIVNSTHGDLWNLATVNLTMDGDGSAVQTLEVMSEDRGISKNATSDNFAWGNLRVASGASVRLADEFDNSLSDGGAPEALYVNSLILEPGARLDLNGHNVYYFGTLSVDETALLIENGGALIQAPVSLAPVSNTIFPLEGFSAEAGNGYWIGPMAVGDLDGDGKVELVFQTTDEESTDGDGGVFAYKYEKGALKTLPGFPIDDEKMRTYFNYSADAKSYIYLNNLRIVDLGTGRGNEAVFTYSSGVYSLDAAGEFHTLISGMGYTYAAGRIAIADIDRDGRMEISTCGRNAAGENVSVHSINESGAAELRFRASVPAQNGIVAMSAMADVDGDKRPEVLFIPTGDTSADQSYGGTAGVSYGLSVFKADGTPATSQLDSSLTLTNIHVSAYFKEGPGGLSAADFTGDGVPEFFICSAGDAKGHFNIVDQAGNTILQVTSVMSNGFALFDFDKDGDYEVLYGNTLYDYRDGEAVAVQTLPQPTAFPYFMKYVTPVLADFTGDQIPEAVYLARPSTSVGDIYGRAVIVYDFVQQKILPGFPISLSNPEADTEYWGMGRLSRWMDTIPLIADLDHDGCWEIVAFAGSFYNRTAQTFTGYLNIIDTPYAVPDNGLSAMETGWTMMGHDMQNTFVYPASRIRPSFLILR